MIAHFIPSVDFLQEKEPLQPKVGFDKFKMFEDSSLDDDPHTLTCTFTGKGKGKGYQSHNFYNWQQHAKGTISAPVAPPVSSKGLNNWVYVYVN